MPRPKGSKNKPKTNKPNGKGKDHVTPGQDQEPKEAQAKGDKQSEESTTSLEQTPTGQDGGDAPAGSAACASAAGGDGEAPPKDVVGGLDEHKAEPAPKLVGDDLVKRLDEMNANIRSLWHDRALEKIAAADDAKEHSDEIKRIEKAIDDLVKRVDELDVDECIHHERGIVEYRSRSTGALLRTRAMTFAERQEKLDTQGAIGNRPITVAPPKPTFDQLQDGKVWEQDEHGVCRILAVLDGSVRVQTEDLDEDEAGIEIGSADWNAHSAYPREVPELEIGKRWHVTDLDGTITALDDVAACIAWDKVETPGRVSRLSFCSSAAHEIKPIEISAGTRIWLDNKAMVDGKALVVVVLAEEVDGHILCHREDTDVDEQIEAGRVRRGDVMLPAQAGDKKRKPKKSDAAATEA